MLLFFRKDSVYGLLAQAQTKTKGSTSNNQTHQVPNHKNTSSHKKEKKGTYHTLQRFMPLNAVKIRKNTMQRRTLYTQEKRKNKYQHVKKTFQSLQGIGSLEGKLEGKRREKRERKISDNRHFEKLKRSSLW